MTHVTSVRELHRLVSKDIYQNLGNVQEAYVIIPSYDYLLKQFTPKNKYVMKADRYFSNLPFQLSLSGRSNHVKHVDFEYTQIVKKYMKEYAVENRDISMFIQVDDKNKVGNKISRFFIKLVNLVYSSSLFTGTNWRTRTTSDSNRAKQTYYTSC